MKNWKTSLAAILATIGLAMTESQDETLKAIGKAIEAIGLVLVGLSAKDHNITGNGK